MSSEKPLPELQKGQNQQLAYLAVIEGPISESTTDRSARDEPQADRHPADCDCLPTFEDLPCWPCYRDGLRMLNPDDTADG